MGDRRVGCQQDDSVGMIGESCDFVQVVMDGESGDGDEDEKVKRRK